MKTDEHIIEVVERLTRSWNASDIEGVLRYYTDDVEYSELGAGVVISGKEGLRKYLKAYFAAWESRWISKKHYRLACRTGRRCCVGGSAHR